ncbi:uncharacterized protein LOC142584563 [Dermacentor variabilis]|uniref:uncharacterized protein LOC142584563 n=1 Tax=Dermacentor variabilis TaxID=34621 RepID=UPI003F5C4F12
MPGCCAPNCQFNYDGGRSVRVQKFPSDRATREAWTRAVPRKDFSLTKHTVVSALFSFPSRLQNLVNEMLRTNTQLGQMRKLSIGGSQVTETLARRALQVFPKLHNLRNFYGMTESCGLIAAPGQDEINFEDLGIPSPNVEIKVLSSDNRELLGPNQHGEILFRMPSVMRGYYKKPDETAQALLKDGWCKSGVAWWVLVCTPEWLGVFWCAHHSGFVCSGLHHSVV